MSLKVWKAVWETRNDNGKTYSVRFYTTVLEQMRTKKAGAAMYIADITRGGMLWSNLQWTDANEHLPPRFGIVTSKTAESVNSIFNAAQDLPWMDALENIIDVMRIRQICACRKQYKKRSDAFSIVPRAQRLVNSRWDATASISVRCVHHEHMGLRWSRR